MAKFVIAGSANCPYFAKAELLADYLQKNLPDFQVHKITQHPDVWEKWLQDLCEKNNWKHKRSPIIWRELLDRGGKSLLLGGFNDFLEHAELYYNMSSKMITEEMMLISGENLKTHIEIEQEQEDLKKEINPLKIWITGASCRTCYNLIPLLVNGEVFGMKEEISIHLLNNNFEEDDLDSIVMEGQDLAAPLLWNISMCTVKEEAFLEAEVIIILADDVEAESESLENRIKARYSLCQLYGSLIEKNAHRSVKVIVAGKTFLNLTSSLLITFAPSIYPRNVIAVAMMIENEAKAMLARKLKTPANGEFGIPEGMVFSMPVTCENGIWYPCVNLTETELAEDVKGAIIHDLEQEKLIAFGEVLAYQPYVPVAEIIPRENRVRIQIDDNEEEDQREQSGNISHHSNQEFLTD
ncbi:putative malate dehydrogenase 1B isoform X5 [Macrotis lagotis]|uniref:putative malate dehydrogenase 1B isoform X5 n=1 Tax=Macrotis lagotis TaxID=92651 RepID=UPI003D68D1A5